MALILVLASASARAAPTAEQLCNEGQREYLAGRYANAIARWQAAYAASRISVLIFDIAQAQRRAGDCASALASYRQYVTLESTSTQSDLARGFMSELEPTCGVMLIAPRADRPRGDPGRGLKIAGVAIGGAGVLALAVGLSVGHHATTLGTDVSAACAVDCAWSAQHTRDAAGRRDANIGYALDGVGVAALVGGAVLYYLGSREHRGPALTIAPHPREGGAVLLWSRAW